MHAAPSHQLFDRLILLLVVVAVASGLTVLQVIHPSWQQVKSGVERVASILPLPQFQAAEQSEPETAVPHTVVTTPSKPEVTAKTATTTTYVHLRGERSTSAAIVADIEPGMTIELREGSDATWQAVRYQGKNGYIYKTYLQY